MRPFLKRGGVTLAVVLGLPATGALAAAAYVCHPDPPGTKTARIDGEVTRYAMHGNRVSLLYRAGAGCLRTRWTIGTSPARARRVDAASCEAVERPAPGRFSLIEGSADAPDRIRFGGAARSWPLPERVTRLDAFGGTAVFAGKREVYAIRRSDGRVALVGLDRRGDSPQIEAPGVVFQDNLDKSKERTPRTLMKFIPAAAVEKALTDSGRPIRLPGRIETFAMDGFRVAVGIRPSGDCARIMYWNIAWNYRSRITDEDERTCRLTRSGGRIKSIAIGGIQSAWAIRSRGADRILTSNSRSCFDRVVATVHRRGGGVTSLSGDGAGLAYAVRNDAGRENVVGFVRARSAEVVAREGSPIALSADDGRLAVLNRDESVDIRLENGVVGTTIQAPGAISVALRATRLVVLTRNDRLQVFDTQTQQKLHDWPAPDGVANRVDVQYGVAVLTSGGKVYAVSLDTGRTALVAKAPSAAHAEIEPPGIAYAFNRGSRGSLRFIPFAEVEAGLR